jgi:hypothetical protein
MLRLKKAPNFWRKILTQITGTTADKNDLFVLKKNANFFAEKMVIIADPNIDR